MNPVYRTLYAEMVDIGGFPVRQPLPTRNVEQFDPFLLLHHHVGDLPPHSDYKNAGVGPHPHRGFSPVTFIFQGSIHHRDSRGNSSIVDAGGVQWMNAGMGIIHSERPSKQFVETGGTQEIVQLWINTPAAKKMDPPTYQAFQKNELVHISPDHGNGQIALVSGNLNGMKGPVNTTLPIVSAMVSLEKESGHRFEIAPGQRGMLYLLEGTLQLEGYGRVDNNHLVLLEDDLDAIVIKALDSTRLLFLSGKPIGEPVATFGPYVMNNQSEILEAMRDYQMGKMGILIEEFD